MEKELPEGLEWCQKDVYSVKIELGCYPIDEEHPLRKGFEKETFNINGYDYNFAVKSGFNILEQNNWKTDPDKCFIITGTVNEQWPVKAKNLSAYDVEIKDIDVYPSKVFTKDSSSQEMMVCCQIPAGQSFEVIPSWSFRDEGTIDQSQVMIANSENSQVGHGTGDYIVAKHIEGQPEYMELPEEIRNTKEMSELYDPRIVNGEVMENTYIHSPYQEELKEMAQDYDYDREPY